MCYTGLCPYEITSGPYAGECTCDDGKYPDDAGCVIAEREIAVLEKAPGEIDSESGDVVPFT